MNKDLQNLMKYPEFYAFKAETLKYIEKLKDDFTELSLADGTFALQAAALNATISALRDYLSHLGVLDEKVESSISKTYE